MAENLFPIFLKLAGRSSLVVGAGEIAASKIRSLLDAGAHVTVVAPRAGEEIQQLAAVGKIRWAARIFLPGDLENVFLAIAATSDAEVNRLVFLESQRRGILCNSVDDPPHCDFYFPSVVRRGDLQVAISTAGESPSLAQRLRIELEASLDARLGEWLREIGELRREILAAVPASDARKSLLHRLASRESWEAWQRRQSVAESAEIHAGDPEQDSSPVVVGQ
ncbi:MAG TPA: bifunctional precorrin-2 dehydrogenase/sirohydrochlorin ferrochelatase [Verrucomicrobiae bacterium]|nr:bifunctional precorrin-2 dehydrogenase/sirohydrochlorin ferrochelatase [Verrucomicrobiae bacterium]